MIIINKGTVFEVLLPISVGLILAALTAVAIGLGIIVLRQPYVVQAYTVQPTSPSVSSLSQVSKSNLLEFQKGTFQFNEGLVSQIPPPVVKRVINRIFKLLDPAQQMSEKGISLTPFRLSQTAFPFSNTRALIADARVKRPTLTSGLYNLEPVDDIGSHVQIIPGHYLRLYWFNQLETLRDERVYHSWYYKNILMSRVEINVKSQNYRASSYKTILPHQQGQWRVVTETLDEQPLSTHFFEVTL